MTLTTDKSYLAVKQHLDKDGKSSNYSSYVHNIKSGANATELASLRDKLLPLLAGEPVATYLMTRQILESE